MKVVQLSRSTVVVVVSSSAVWAAWRILRWRARKRARETVHRVEQMIPQNAPLIDFNDPELCERILKGAIRRASKWMALIEEAKPMVGQVGGISIHKKPLLTIEPDYVMKPVLTDHRGIREIAFYEAIKTLSHNPSITTYTAFLNNKERSQSTLDQMGDKFDTLAMALAIFLQDPVVTGSEAALNDAWKRLKKEVDSLHQLAKFSPQYYGVVGQTSVVATEEAPYGVTPRTHLLLQDLTVNYSEPCVMDLKMGSQSYEPDAPPEKRHRELSKYPEQSQFNLRVVGMRIYDPNHPEADGKGYRHFDKAFGRSLKTYDDLLGAFRIFFSANMLPSSNGSSSSGDRIRTRSISNIVSQLRPIRGWFEENVSLRFYASSLLLVYEGDRSPAANADWTTAKMIDFVRVRREKGGDEGYLAGLRMLKGLLVRLLEEDEQQR